MFFKSHKEPIVNEKEVEDFSLTEKPAKTLAQTEVEHKAGVCRTTAYKVYAEKSKEQGKE